MANFTKDDFVNMSGMDLNDELTSRLGNITNNANEIFISQIEDLFEAIYFVYGFKGTTSLTNEHQRNCYKKAINYQILYELQNGSLWNDAGYTIGTGLVVNPIELHKLGIPPHVHEWMRKGGLANV